ncbi:hypothetical protein M408DRAFT_98346 [Serendipita vermifera MAFF 305830]|uniref:Uncharacterized protein n=1 Tax=Serendipita vermifera MAFF 305830 TaxID=933852 RepID=A0A0C3AZD9_SERVB|nr:hypothetical protein M408DRAFT_98346 [Serendipita vermifera MAFF 305830]
MLRNLSHQNLGPGIRGEICVSQSSPQPLCRLLVNDSTTRPRVSPLSSNSTSTLQPPAHSHVDTEPLSNANSSLMFSHSFEQGRHQESPSPQASHDNMDLEAEVVHPKHDSPSTMPSGAFQVHDESNEPLFIAELQQDSSVSVVLGNKDNEEGTESFADGLQLLNSHLFQQAAPMPWTASLLSLNSDGFTNDISKRTNQRVRDKTSHAAEAMTKLNRLNLETRCLTLPEWTKIRSQITIADENEESVLFINGFHGVAPMRTPPRQSLLSPSIPDKAVGNLVTSLPAPKFDLAHECLFHYIKIHLLGLLGNTYFRLRTWKLLNVHNEKTQCTESLFIIENSTSNSLPNRMAAHVFFKSFKRFVSKGIYNSEIIGDLCSSSNVVLEAFHDELARYLHLYNASSKDPLCSTLLKKDRRDARRIASTIFRNGNRSVMYPKAVWFVCWGVVVPKSAAVKRAMMIKDATHFHMQEKREHDVGTKVGVREASLTCCKA